jgi:hypothetical protein
MSGYIHEGDTGTELNATVVDQFGTPVNVSTATVLNVYFQRPNGTRFTRTAVFETGGADGRIQYTLQAGDIDMDGTWVRQWHVEMPAGKWTSDEISFFVKAVI